MNTSRLLVGFNFSEGSYTAFWHAVQLARRGDHRVTLLHVDAAGTSTRSFLGRRRRQMLDELARAARRHEVDVDARLHTGGVAQTFESVVVDEGVDLVVLGRHEARAWTRPRRGQLAAALVGRLDVPVLVVPGTASPDAAPYRHLLVSSYLRGRDEPLLTHALDLRDALGARLTLVDATRRAPARRRGVSPRIVGDEPAFAQLSPVVRARLRDGLNCTRDDGHPQIQVVHSGLRRPVLRVAQALDVDLLVLGESAVPWLGRLRHGTASRLRQLRRASMPMLSVPSRAPTTAWAVAGASRMVR